MMETTRILYADVLFFVNFSMDCIALYLTGRITHSKIRLTRLIAAASVGALYGVCAVIFDHAVFTALCGTVVGALMCLIAVKPAGCFDFSLKWGLFWLVNASLGGGMTIFYNILNAAGFRSMAEADGGTDKKESLLFGAVMLFCLIFIQLLRRCGSSRLRAKTAEVTVCFNGHTVQFDALIDSGNLLTDPLSGKPVIVASQRLFLQILPPYFLEAVTGKNTSRLHDLSGHEILKRVRLIAVKGSSGDRIIPGFLPDSVSVAVSDKKGRGIVCDAVLALEEADETYFGGYAGTVPMSLICL